MCCNKNRTNTRAYTYGAGCRRGNAPYSQRAVPDAYYAPAPYSQDTTTTSIPTVSTSQRSHRHFHQRPCRQGGLVALLIDLVRERRASHIVVDEMGGDKNWDGTRSHHQGREAELETKERSGMRDGDGVYEKNGLLDDDHDDDDESAREAAELPSYEAA